MVTKALFCTLRPAPPSIVVIAKFRGHTDPEFFRMRIKPMCQRFCEASLMFLSPPSSFGSLTSKQPGFQAQPASPELALLDLKLETSEIVSAYA